MDDSLQPTVDMLLNLAIFMWFGAVCPWASFVHNDIIPIYRLIFLGILILLVRRMPIVFAMHKYIHQIEQLSQAAFVGFFGPIGVGAIFYLSVSREYLRENVTVDGKPREDAKKVADTINVVVWFLVMCSIVSPHDHYHIDEDYTILYQWLTRFFRSSTAFPFLLARQDTTSHAPSQALSVRAPPWNQILSPSQE